MNPADLYATSNALAAHYSRFRVTERILLSGHSHQAWPDVGFAAQQQAWLDAAELVDDKWERAFAKSDEVRRGYARLMNDPDGDIALGPNTLELIVRLLSALPLRERPKLISSDAEFHTLRRLFNRLEEEPVEIVRVPADPIESLTRRIADEVDDRTAAAFVSSVLFQSARIVPHLPALAEACRRNGAVCVIDAYHHLNVVPFSIDGLENAYILGGGYKYCQLGEGNCALRLPRDCNLRPVTTGWFSEFGALTAKQQPNEVLYGAGGRRFEGATYDPASHYRAAASFAFFEEQGLNPGLLREVSQHQLGLLIAEFDALNLDPSIIRRDDILLEQRGGFLVLWSPQAGEFCTKLKSAGVYTDYRDNALRLGPAPYLSDEQLKEAVNILGKIVKQ